MVLAGDVDGMEQALRADLLDVSRFELQVLKAPSELVARQHAFAEFFLSLAHSFNGQNAIQDAEVVVNAADARLVSEITFSGAVNGLDDVLQDRRIRYRRSAS